MRLERPRRCAPVNGLQNGRFYFQPAFVVENTPHGTHHFGAFHKNILHVRVHNQVHVALAESLLWVGKAVIDFAIYFLDHGQRAQRFVQNFKLLHVYRNFTRLGRKNKSFCANAVADVQ